MTKIIGFDIESPMRYAGFSLMAVVFGVLTFTDAQACPTIAGDFDCTGTDAILIGEEYPEKIRITQTKQDGSERIVVTALAPERLLGKVLLEFSTGAERSVIRSGPDRIVGGVTTVFSYAACNRDEIVAGLEHENRQDNGNESVLSAQVTMFMPKPNGELSLYTNVEFPNDGIGGMSLATCRPLTK